MSRNLHRHLRRPDDEIKGPPIDGAVKPLGGETVKTKDGETQHNEVFLLADSIQQKFLLMSMFNDAKKYGPDNPRGKKALEGLKALGELALHL